MTPNPGNDEKLRSELTRLGAREYEMVALGMIPDRGLAALQVALAKGVQHPVAYAIALFDSDEWSPTGEKPRRGTNLHVGYSKPMPPPRRLENLAEAKKILARLKGEE